MDMSAAHIIAKCGGPQAVAEMLGVDLTTVHKWKYSRAKGGTDGRIPTSRQHELLKRAQKAGIKLSPEDFFASAADAADLQTEAAQ